MVTAPIRPSVAVRPVLRPIRSPTHPEIAAPIGRATKPTNWVEKDSRVPAGADSPGKNTAGNTRAAAAATDVTAVYVPDRSHRHTDLRRGRDRSSPTSAQAKPTTACGV
jgi:hypothetical protein